VALFGKKRGRPKKSESTDGRGTPTWWLQEIQRAKDVKEEWSKRFRIPLAYDYFEGAQKPSGYPDDEWITINLVYSSILAELPSLYSTDPYYYIKLARSYSVNPQDIALFEKRAKVRQSMLNYIKREIDLKTTSRVNIFDAFFQFGVSKVHYHSTLQDNENAGNPLMDSSGGVMVDENGEAMLEPETIPVGEAYVVSRIHPDDFFVDPEASSLDNTVRWRCHRYKEHIDYFKTNKRYTAEARKEIKATEAKDESEKERERRKKGGLATRDDTPEPEYIVLYEIWNAADDEWFVVADGYDKFVRQPDEMPPGTEDHPFVTLRYTMRDDSWYPLPPVSQWLDSQYDYCMFRSKLSTHLKRFNRKYELDETLVSDWEQSATDLTLGDDGTVIRARGQGISAVRPISDAPLDQQLHTNLAYLRNDFQDLAVGANQRGARSGVDSATEAGILEKRAVLREGDRVGLVVDFLQLVGRKLDQLVQVHIDKDQAVKVTGPESETYWELIRVSDYDDIAGEYEYTINVGSVTPQLPEIERAQWTAFLGLLASAPFLATSKRLLEKGAEMHHINDEALVEELFKIATQQVQMQQQQQQAKGVGGGISNPMPASGGGAGINNIRGGG